MTIRINQIAVDFTLEKEKTFADLTVSMRAWGTGQNLAILGILADGRALGPEDVSPLASINEIDVEAVPAGERDLARVAVVSRFFALLAHAGEQKDQSLIKELREEFASVRGALDQLLRPVAARLAEPLAILDAPWSDSPAFQSAAQKVAEEAEAIRRELQNPREALRESAAVLAQRLTSLETLPFLFQQGHDKDALDLILGLFVVFEDLSRRMAAVLATPETATAWNGFNAELLPLFREAEAALAAKDYILLTDLLEYEVTPRLKTVETFIPSSNLDPVPDLL